MLENIEIRGSNPEEARSLLRLLPENTFKFTQEFIDGLPHYDAKAIGQIGIYAEKEPLLGDRGLKLVVVNEHLFGNPMESSYNPTLNIPEGAKEICLVPPRSPLHQKINGGPFTGVEFSYKNARFFFGYEAVDNKSTGKIGAGSFPEGGAAIDEVN